MAEILTRLGRILLLEGDNAGARHYYEQARIICHDLGVINGLIISLEGMGNSARAMGDYGEARRYFREALQRSAKYLPLHTPSILVGIGELLLQTGQQAHGIELLVLAVHHPASEQDTKDRAQRLINQYQVTAEAENQTAANVDLNTVATALLDELLIAESKPLTNQTPQANETLIEPLSEREFEILKLIAEGLSNREIADQLILSGGTVKWYTSHIFSKLGVQSRTQALGRARQLNLLP
jgi:DNA-binding NarL/FixJ family response regulator